MRAKCHATLANWLLACFAIHFKKLIMMNAERGRRTKAMKFEFKYNSTNLEGNGGSFISMVHEHEFDQYITGVWIFRHVHFFRD